jgi:MYXO-CTERM domain-containing protein
VTIERRFFPRSLVLSLAWICCCLVVASRAHGGFASDILVTDLNNGNFKVFDPTTGNLLGTFGAGHLVNPRGITGGPDGNIYVNDVSTHSVQEFSGTTGAWIKQFVPAGDGVGYPYGMTFGPNGDLYVASYITNTVVEFRLSDGATERTIGTGSSLQVPTGIAFGPDGNLYVGSSLNTQILVFNPNTGAFIKNFGPGILQISGMAFGNGYLYVAAGQPGSSAFGILDATTGAVVAAYNDTTHEKTPGGLYVGLDGKLYLASYGTDSIDRYNADGTFDTVFINGAAVGLSGPIYIAGPALVPEPSSLVLAGFGVVGLAGLAVRQRRRQTAG